MNDFLLIAAVLAWLFGGVLLLAPEELYAATGLAMTPMMATVAQAYGATLIGLGVIDILARGAGRQGAVAVMAGNLVIQALSLVVALKMIELGAGKSVLPIAVIHLVLGTLFCAFLVRATRLPA